MKSLFRLFRPRVALPVLLTIIGHSASVALLAQPMVVNGSFEVDPLPPSPGYGSVTGWLPDGGLIDGYGLNEMNGPFADNGLIPDGAKAAFIQDNGTLFQIVSGFTVGAPYRLQYFENARGLCCGDRVAALAVLADDQVIVAEHTVMIAGSANPYRLVTSRVFTAPSPEMRIAFIKGGAGDSTALIDDVRIYPAEELSLLITLEEASVPFIRLTGLPDAVVEVQQSSTLGPEAGWHRMSAVRLSPQGESTVLDPSAALHQTNTFYRARYNLQN